MAVNLSPVGGVAAQFFDNNGVPLSGGFLYTYAAGTSTPQATYTSSNGNTAQANPMVLDSSGRVPSGEIWLTDGSQYKFVLQNANSVLIGTYDNIIGINSNFVNFTNQQEIQTATASQTVFTLTTMQYQPGTGSLSVFVDGVNQYGPGAQYAYTETSSTVVTFVNGLHVGASVKFTTSAINASSYGTAADISYTPAGTGAVATNVQAKLRQTVSVKDFGAVGDGTTNDTAAIQAALDSGAQEVTVPWGTYKITGLEIKSASVLTSFRGVGTPVLSLVTSSNAKAITVSKSQFLTVSGFNITSSGSSSDGNSTRGIYAESKSFMQFNNLRFTNFSLSGFEAKQVVYFTLTGITVADCLYGISFTSTIAAPCTTCTVTSSYITGCPRGIFQESGVQMVYKDCIFEYCGTSGGNNGAFHANGGGALLIGAYFEANQRNIVASDTGLSFINKYELAATTGNVITYSGTAFNLRGTTDIESNTINTRFLAPDAISGYDLQMGTNLVAPLAGGSVVFGNETMYVANGTLTTATWTTVYTIPTNELSGAVNLRALYEYTCYSGTSDLSTGFDSGTIMNGVLRSYSGTTPAWLRLSSNTVQMNVTAASYGLLYKIVMRRVYPS